VMLLSAMLVARITLRKPARTANHTVWCTSPAELSYSCSEHVTGSPNGRWFLRVTANS
jgi:hypothetical protein